MPLSLSWVIVSCTARVSYRHLSSASKIRNWFITDVASAAIPGCISFFWTMFAPIATTRWVAATAKWCCAWLVCYPSRWQTKVPTHEVHPCQDENSANLLKERCRNSKSDVNALLIPRSNSLLPDLVELFQPSFARWAQHLFDYTPHTRNS